MSLNENGTAVTGVSEKMCFFVLIKDGCLWRKNISE